MSSLADKSFYYFRHQLDPNQLPSNVTTSLLTKRYYIKKLLFLHIFGSCLILLSGILQLLSILTTEWYILNVNEYIPTSKGGLWNYCFIGTSGDNTKYTCMRYEELPNFALFVNQRLHDSRILLVCSCGFTFFLLCIEMSGLLYVSLINKNDDQFDMILNHCRTPVSQNNNYQNNDRKKSQKISDSSARFTTSNLIINGTVLANNTIKINEQIDKLYDLILKKPDGYMSFLACSIITTIGGFMDIILKVAGFTMFDSYIKYLLSYNTVFLTYRSYSYWFFVVSICIHSIYWFYKIASTRYIVQLTRKLIETRENLYSIICRSRAKSLNSFETEVKEIRTRRVSNIKEIKNQFDNKVTNANRQVLNKIDNIDKSSPFPYDFTEDDLSSASFSSSSSDSLTNNNNHNLPVNSNNQITSFVNNSVTDDSIIRF